MCTKAPATVDCETGKLHTFVDELDGSFKRFNSALTLTMTSFRDLLTAFDQIAQAYGNIGSYCSPAVKDSVFAFRDGMRDSKDKGPFVAFNAEVHAGSISIFDSVKAELKKAQKSCQELKSKQKDYDSRRNEIEKKERTYAKKDKPLQSSESYQKNITKRDTAKAVYEEKRLQYETDVAALKAHSEQTILGSMNNYIRCVSTLSQYIDANMTLYRTNLHEPHHSSSALERMRDDAVLKTMAKIKPQAEVYSQEEISKEAPTAESVLTPHSSHIASHGEEEEGGTATSRSWTPGEPSPGRTSTNPLDEPPGTAERTASPAADL